MKWLTQRIDEGSKTVGALLAEPAWVFDGRMRSRLPDEPGIYVISLRVRPRVISFERGERVAAAVSVSGSTRTT
jgi:hypothetical protein